MKRDDVSTGEPLSQELKDKLCQFGKATKPTLYTIKPLEWGIRADYIDKVVAHTSVNNYMVKFDVHGKYTWKYYSDTISSNCFPCTSIEDGKAQAEKHYEEQLLQGLREVECPR